MTDIFHKIRHPKKSAFLAAFRECGNIRQAALASGVDRTSYYVWCERDEHFAFAAEQAKVEAKEALEQEARRRAMDGVRQETPIFYKGERVATVVKTEYSDILLMFLLKKLDPSYRERFDINQTVMNAGSDLDISDDEALAIRDSLRRLHG